MLHQLRAVVVQINLSGHEVTHEVIARHIRQDDRSTGGGGILL
jgi:hypothetical protein